MGDMADDAIDRMLDEYDAQLNDGYGYGYRFKDCLLDDDGEPIQWVFGRSPSKPKPIGPGKCPVCGCETVKKTGKFGQFYGCVRFPDCKGSRSGRDE